VTRPAALSRGAAFPKPRIGFGGISLILFMSLATASWVFILSDKDSGFASFFQAETWAGAVAFLTRFLGVNGAEPPAYLRLERWADMAGPAYETLAMSVLAASIVGIGVMLTFMPAARNVAMGELSASHSFGSRVLFFLIRGIYIFVRGVPELVWAMLIIFFLSPGVLPGAVALGLHNFGIVGKLSAEVVENLDSRPARALRAAGASQLQMLAYAILPMALPGFLTYLLYRWEVIIRTTIVVGFVGAGGLGREFRLSMSWFQYTDVALLLAVYLLLVIFVDLCSAWMRKLAR